MTTITAMTTIRQIENRACLRRLRVEDFYNVRNQQRSAPRLHVHRLPSKPAPRERQRSSQDSIVPSASHEWKNFRSTVEPALHTGSIAPEISRYSRAREQAESGSAVSKFLMTVLR